MISRFLSAPSRLLLGAIEPFYRTLVLSRRPLDMSPMLGAVCREEQKVPVKKTYKTRDQILLKVEIWIPYPLILLLLIYGPYLSHLTVSTMMPNLAAFFSGTQRGGEGKGPKFSWGWALSSPFFFAKTLGVMTTRVFLSGKFFFSVFLKQDRCDVEEGWFQW